jgi:preprotein translocase subunit SecE
MAANSSPTAIDNVRQAAGGRIERARLFLSEVRNELKRVTWPSRREVYATTVVVVIMSAAVGMYLFAIDQLLIWIVERLFRFFGAA